MIRTHRSNEDLLLLNRVQYYVVLIGFEQIKFYCKNARQKFLKPEDWLIFCLTRVLKHVSILHKEWRLPPQCKEKSPAWKSGTYQTTAMKKRCLLKIFSFILKPLIENLNVFLNNPFQNESLNSLAICIIYQALYCIFIALLNGPGQPASQHYWSLVFSWYSNGVLPLFFEKPGSYYWFLWKKTPALPR